MKSKIIALIIIILFSVAPISTTSFANDNYVWKPIKPSNDRLNTTLGNRQINPSGGSRYNDINKVPDFNSGQFYGQGKVNGGNVMPNRLYNQRKNNSDRVQQENRNYLDNLKLNKPIDKYIQASLNAAWNGNNTDRKMAAIKVNNNRQFFHNCIRGEMKKALGTDVQRKSPVWISSFVRVNGELLFEVCNDQFHGN